MLRAHAHDCPKIEWPAELGPDTHLGEILMGVDLARATIVEQNAYRRKLILRLPVPTAVSCRLDHQATSLYSIERHALWTLVPFQRPTTAVVNKSFADAEQHVGDVARQPEVVAAAKAHTGIEHVNRVVVR